MAYFTRAEVRSAYTRSRFYRPGRTPTQVLRETIASRQSRSSWDVFLSHSALDKEEVLGVREKLIEDGKTVYVDWIDDPELDRSHVTSETADVLRRRMKACVSMIYALSPSASQSRWMPWELGYFDGIHGRQIAIMPIVDSQSDFKGQEYLGLYPAVEKLNDATGRQRTYILNERREWMTLGKFASGERSFQKP